MSNMYNVPKPDGALEVGDVFTCSKIGIGTYLVDKTDYSGGGYGHGLHDIYPNGWHVHYIEIKPEDLNLKVVVTYCPESPNDSLYQSGSFAQSGSFSNKIDPSEIKKIAKLKVDMHWTAWRKE